VTVLRTRCRMVSRYPSHAIPALLFPLRTPWLPASQTYPRFPSVPSLCCPRHSTSAAWLTTACAFVAGATWPRQPHPHCRFIWYRPASTCETLRCVPGIHGYITTLPRSPPHPFDTFADGRNGRVPLHFAVTPPLPGCGSAIRSQLRVIRCGSAVWVPAPMLRRFYRFCDAFICIPRLLPAVVCSPSRWKDIPSSYKCDAWLAERYYALFCYTCSPCHLTLYYPYHSLPCLFVVYLWCRYIYCPSRG
jgi:hypothetical protein